LQSLASADELKPTELTAAKMKRLVVICRD
jgi:hypothetical protein